MSFALEGAYSGGRCLTLKPPPGGELRSSPPFRQQFGETIRNWDFEIVEHPEPGQYRYLQFAWKALSPQTKGMTLRVSEGNSAAHPSPPAIHRQWKARRSCASRKPAGNLASRPRRSLGADQEALASSRPVSRARGGGAAFDQIVLGRTEADLPKIEDGGNKKR